MQTANFLGYFCMAIPAALVMRRWGYKAGMIMGLCFFGFGMSGRFAGAALWIDEFHAWMKERGILAK